MFTRRKSKAAKESQGSGRVAAEGVGLTEQSRPSVVGRVPAAEAANGGPASCIGSGMSIVGNIECSGPAQIFGQIEGEVRGSDLLIGEGARVEGSIIAQDVTILGEVKGVIRAVRVRLHGGGMVEGDIFHRSLSIDESSLFQGSSRRVENPTDPESDLETKEVTSKMMQASASSSLPSMDIDLQRRPSRPSSNGDGSASIRTENA